MCLVCMIHAKIITACSSTMFWYVLYGHSFSVKTYNFFQGHNDIWNFERLFNQCLLYIYVNKWHIHIQWRTVQSKSMSITKNMWYFIKLINSFILFSATRLWRYCPKRSASSFKSGTSKDNTWWMDWNNAKEFSHPTMSDWVPRYSKTLQIKHSYHSIGSSKTYIMKRYENCTEITAQWPIYIRAPLHDSFRPERNDQSQAVFFWQMFTSKIATKSG